MLINPVISKHLFPLFFLKKFLKDCEAYQSLETLLAKMKKSPLHEYQVKPFEDANHRQDHSLDYSSILDLMRHAGAIIPNPSVIGGFNETDDSNKKDDSNKTLILLNYSLIQFLYF